jgi:hypothetical protein
MKQHFGQSELLLQCCVLPNAVSRAKGEIWSSRTSRRFVPLMSSRSKGRAEGSGGRPHHSLPGLPLLHGLRPAVRASAKAPFAKPLAASSPPSAVAAAAAAARPTCSPFDVRAHTAKLERGYLLALKVRAAMGAGAALQDALQRLRAAGAPQRAANMRSHELRTRWRMYIVVSRGWRTRRRGSHEAGTAAAWRRKRWRCGTAALRRSYRGGRAGGRGGGGG